MLTNGLYLSSTSELNHGQSNVVTEEDLEHLWRLVEMKDGGPTWIKMMDRSTETMSYQAWGRDPKVGYLNLYCIHGFSFNGTINL